MKYFKNLPQGTKVIIRPNTKRKAVCVDVKNHMDEIVTIKESITNHEAYVLEEYATVDMGDFSVPHLWHYSVIQEM